MCRVGLVATETLHNPRNEQRSRLFVGVFNLIIASFAWVVISRQRGGITWPLYSILPVKELQFFFNFRVISSPRNGDNTFYMFSMWSHVERVKKTISSKYTWENRHLTGDGMKSIAHQNIFGAFFKRKRDCMKRFSPQWDENIVLFWSVGLTSICHKPM